jgi:hypothetical protein
MTRKELILTTIDDAVSDLLYYGRKEDEELPRDAIDEAVRNGEITVDEMVAKFKQALDDGLEI